MVRLGGWAEDLGEDRLQGVSPYLIALRREMQSIRGHSLDRLSVLVRQPVVQVEKANGGRLRQFGKAGVDSGDARDPSCHRIDSGDVKSTFFPSIIAIAA